MLRWVYVYVWKWGVLGGQVIVIPLRPLLPDGFDQGLLLMEGDLVVWCSAAPPLSKLISEFIAQDTIMM